MLAILMVASGLCLAAIDARAQASDTTGIERPRARTERASNGERPRPWHRHPWAVMTRSLIVPGWGQLQNGRPLKAALAVAAEGAAAWQVARAQRDLDRALDNERRALRAGDEEAAARYSAEYDAAYDRRSSWIGWLAIAVGVSMADAYVDAHFLQFDADFGSDPGLPEAALPDPRNRGETPTLRGGFAFRFTGP